MNEMAGQFFDGPVDLPERTVCFGRIFSSRRGALGFDTRDESLTSGLSHPIPASP